MTPQSAAVIVMWVLSFLAAIAVWRSPTVLAFGFVLGWLFLPNFVMPFAGTPDWDKPILVSVVSAVATFAIPRRSDWVSGFSWMDMPAFGVALFSVPPSVVNGLGLYDGLSVAYTNFWVWTVPYLIGRRVFCTPENARILLRVVILGGMIYVLFCLYEIKMSPRLHWVVYGVRPREGQNYFSQAVRYGLWRPLVFMEHGLALAIFMGITSILAWWAHVAEAIPRMAGMSMRIIAVILGLTTVLCVSSGAIALLGLGWGIVLLFRVRVGRMALLLAAMVPLAYPVSRILGSGAIVNAVCTITEFAGEQVGESRTDSFQVRVDNEERLLRQWQTSPIFGRARYFMHLEGKKKVITDSYWIIMLGKMGLCGWLCWTLLLTLPAVIVALRTGSWLFGRDATAGGLSLGPLIFAIDCLLNAMPNPIFVVLSGAAVGLLRYGPVLNDNPSHAIGGDFTLSRRVVRSMWPPPRRP
jgi:hypothetical protein